MNSIKGLIYDWFLYFLQRWTMLGPLRHELITQAQGKTLEIGMGTGLNLIHYQNHVTLVGIEPDKAMRQQIYKKQSSCQWTAKEGDGMNLQFEDQSFDTVVMTLVLCTIPDVPSVLSEIARVLRPNGKLLLLEHVRSPSPFVGRLQDLLTPIWKTMAGGCHLNRNPEIYLNKFGFTIIEKRLFWLGIGRFLILEKAPKP